MRAQEVDLAAAVLECLPAAAAIIDAHGELHGANSKATEALEEGDAIAVAAGRVQLLCPDLNRVFCNALQSTDNATDASFLTIPRARRADFWVLRVRPLVASDPMPLHLITWLDPRHPSIFNWQLLSRIYGLTPAETKVAALVARGNDLGGAAMQIGIRPETARAHLKAAFRKTGLHRQQDLVRVATVVGLLC